jgi:flagellar export protein FliJ
MISEMAGKFVFRLETLLRVRANREREVRRRLGQAQAEVNRLDELNEQSRAAIRAHQDVLASMQAAEIFQPQDLTRGRAWILHLQRECAERSMLRQQAMENVAKIQAELREARQQTRMIEKLRERRFAEHKLQQDRREQARFDDIAQRLRLAAADDGSGATPATSL